MDFQRLARLPALPRLLSPLVSAALLVGGLVVGLVVGLGAQLALAPSADASGARRIVMHTVRPGDTATGLAVRYHAWTAELIRINHLDREATLYVGERIRIPVVVSRAGHAHTGHTHHASRHHASTHPTVRVNWRDPGRPTIRRVIVETATRYDVDRFLALAISWQEAGWQMHHVSSAGAVGAMQVMPDTGRWMSQYAGRRLDLHRTKDNITAGVLLIRVLRDMTHSQKQQIAAYYQGIGLVQRGIILRETRHYVANVKAIERLLHHGWNPA